MHVAVISDTHAPRFWKRCPPGVAQHLQHAELILHAGDVCTPAVLDELGRFAPVRAVLGNNDGPEVAAWGATGTLQFDVEGVAVAMIHDSGPRSGRIGRLRRQFPTAQLVIFGHSHIPWDQTEGDLRILNPGSPTDKRRQPHGTLSLLDITEGAIVRSELVEVS